jgi:hypothetical protein
LAFCRCRCAFICKQEVLEKIIAYFPLMPHRPHRKQKMGGGETDTQTVR